MLKWYAICLTQGSLTNSNKVSRVNMASQSIFSETVSTLERVLDLRSVKHKLVSSNIANVDTPNYQAFDLLIKENMGPEALRTGRLGLKTTSPGHLSATEGSFKNMNIKAAPSFSVTLKGDGNSVDISKMMGTLSENTLMYNAAAQIISKKFQGLNYAISEGK
jgi:flagellar basal-body rod protein FlgB